MHTKKLFNTIGAAILISFMYCNITHAQDRGGPPPPPDGRGARGPREGGPPPPAPEERLLSQLKDMLGSGDDEWAVLGPKIAQIQTLIQQRERFTKPRPPKPPRPVDPNGRDGRGPGPEEDGRSLVVDLKADPRKDALPNSLNGKLLRIYSELVVLVSGGDVPQSRLQVLLDQYRQTRAASDAQLAIARAELKELVTARQEVILVVLGILE